jgi:hypothetical protein
MRHTIFKDTRAYAHNTLPKKGIDFLIGSNASVRNLLKRVAHSSAPVEDLLLEVC